jgi:hypothetical protein
MKSKIIFVLATALVATSCSKEPEVTLVSGVHLDALDPDRRMISTSSRTAGGWIAPRFPRSTPDTPCTTKFARKLMKRFARSSMMPQAAILNLEQRRSR